MKSCDECGRDMWLYDANTWTCKSGHKCQVEQRSLNATSAYADDEPERYVTRTFHLTLRRRVVYGIPAAAGAASALLTTLVLSLF